MVLPACPLLNPASWDAHLPMPRRSSHLDGTSRAFPAPTRASDTSWDDHWNSCGSVFNFQWGQTSRGNSTPKNTMDDRQVRPLALVTNSGLPGNSINSFQLGTENSAKAIQGQDADRDPEVEDPNGLPVSPQPGSQRSAEHRGAVTLGMTPAQLRLGISAGCAKNCGFNSFCQWNIPMFSSQFDPNVCKSNIVRSASETCIPICLTV